MKNAETKTNRIYFAVLFAALAFDLAGRMHTTQPLSSNDLASTTGDTAKQTDTECAKRLVDGKVNMGSEASCTLEYKMSKIESIGTVKKVNRVIKDDKISWSSSTPSEPTKPAPIETKDCSKIDAKTRPVLKLRSA
jgi:hypothetical protein